MRLPETDEEMWRMGHWGIIIMLVGTIISCIYDALKDSC
jgi:predicted membrane channel-forming protein YqfA (hemolysin III family)